MTFLNPFVLLGLAAAAIPLIIHLFNFRKPRTVPFSSLVFLREVQKSTMRRVQVKQWLLLALRTLAIACLVLTFARPTMKGDWGSLFGQRARSSVALVVDNSLSMTLRDTRGEYLQQAREVAGVIAEQMEQGDETFVIRTAETSQARPAAFTHRGPVLDELDATEAQPGSRALTRAAAAAAVLLDEATHLNRELFLLTDLQRTTFSDSLPLPMPPGSRITLVPLGDRRQPNVAIAEVQVSSRILERGQPARLEATLVNHGTEPLDGYLASVFLENERVAQATADLLPGVPTLVRFTVTPQARGWLGGEVQIEDDAFVQDNTRYFTLHVPEQRRLLVVRGDGQATDYLELALSSALTDGRGAFELDVVPETSLAAADLGTYDAVLLVGPRDLSTGEVATLGRYVQEGGGLLLFPGASARTETYDALLASLGGGRFGAFIGSQGSGTPVATLERVDAEHPLFEGIFDTATGTRPEQADVYFALNYSPGRGDEQTLVGLSNGQPFLQEIRAGSGTALVMTVAPDPSWSDLPVRGLFVPMLYRAGYYLSATTDGGGEGGLVTGQAGEFRVSGASATEALTLTGPSGEPFTPEQRGLAGGVLVQTGGALTTPGLYDVRQNERLLRRIAVNLDAAESDLTTLTPADAAARLAALTEAEVKVLDVRTAPSVAAIARQLTEDRYGVELWNVFLGLALILLLAEQLVAARWRPEAVAA